MRNEKAIKHDLELAQADLAEKRDALLNFADMSSAYDRANALSDLEYLYGRIGELTQELRDLTEFEQAGKAQTTPKKVLDMLAESNNERMKSMTGVDDFVPFGIFLVSKSDKENTYWAMYDFKDKNQDLNEVLDKVKESQERFGKGN